MTDDAKPQNEIVLPGCTPTPLASYLKALAVLRLVAEQGGDPQASGCWRDDVFVLRTTLSRDELLRFFLESYAPTPLVAPWNGGSGFFPKDNQEAVAKLSGATHARFEPYRAAIALARNMVSAFRLAESPKNESKQAFLQRMRNSAAESLLPWIDAAVILADGEPRYPPLLGTGGNDGRLDFTNNYMQRLIDLFNPIGGNACAGAEGLLQASLLGSAADGLPDKAIGQFAPGYAGGPNAGFGFEGSAKVNPWDFILMLEGGILFASSAARRLEASSAATLTAPFTVRSRAGTVGSAAQCDDSDARGEIWMPLWQAWLTRAEVFALFAEGRAVMGARPARDGLDFSRAVARLGVDRGLNAFQRYGFLMRSGKAFLATPLARLPVRRNVQSDLIDELEQRDWLSRVQRHARDDNTPGAFRALAAQLDTALFALTQRTDREAVQRVLRLAGRIEAMCANSAKTRDTLCPLPALSASWVVQADDGSAEFRIACALAGLTLPGEVNGRTVLLGLRPHLTPISRDGGNWEPESRLVCWNSGPIARNLASMLHRRQFAAVAGGAEGELLRGRCGAGLADIVDFLDGRTDDRRIAELAAGLACVGKMPVLRPSGERRAWAPPAAYALLKPFFTPESTLRRLDGWLSEDRQLRLSAEIPARLAANDVPAALRMAWWRLRTLGKKLPGREPPSPVGISGARLLAALVIPLADTETHSLLRWLDLESTDEPASITPDHATF